LIDILELPVEQAIRSSLLSCIGNNICYLGQPSRWKMPGEYNPLWKVMVNIPHNELITEIEVH
jgi:hypothetical protein